MNIALFVLDTLRADHLGCYGYFRDTSPTIDKIAREGVLFEDFYASGIATGPGFTSIITGLYPVSHKFYITPFNVPNSYQLDDNIPTLAEILWDNGYTTAAFDNLMNFRSHPKHFVRGYEYYVNVTRSSRWIHHHVIGDEVNRRLIPWIKNHAYEEFFLFVHYWDPHMPYNQPEGFRNVFKRPLGSLEGLKIVESKAGYRYVPGWCRTDMLPEERKDRCLELYDGEIRYVDHCLAQVIQALKTEGVLDDTLIIITSDHGEQLGQHIIWGHAGLHECVVKVPLIMRLPKELPRGVKVKGYAQHADIMPTILEIAGIKTPTQLDGKSLLRLLEGNQNRNYAVCETWGERAIIEGKWKLILHYESELRRLDEVFKSRRAGDCLLYTSPSPRDLSTSRMPSSA